MSYINARVLALQSCENLHIVKFVWKEHTLVMMSLDLGENIQVGREVQLVVKPTHITLTKDFVGKSSCSNKITSQVHSIQKGKLLSVVTIDVDGVVLESIVTLEALESLDIQVGDAVVAFIEATHISISEVLDD